MLQPQCHGVRAQLTFVVFASSLERRKRQKGGTASGSNQVGEDIKAKSEPGRSRRASRKNPLRKAWGKSARTGAKDGEPKHLTALEKNLDKEEEREEEHEEGEEGEEGKEGAKRDEKQRADDPDAHIQSMPQKQHDWIFSVGSPNVPSLTSSGLNRPSPALLTLSVAAAAGAAALLLLLHSRLSQTALGCAEERAEEAGEHAGKPADTQEGASMERGVMAADAARDGGIPKRMAGVMARGMAGDVPEGSVGKEPDGGRVVERAEEGKEGSEARMVGVGERVKESGWESVKGEDEPSTEVRAGEMEGSEADGSERSESDEQEWPGPTFEAPQKPGGSERTGKDGQGWLGPTVAGGAESREQVGRRQGGGERREGAEGRGEGGVWRELGKDGGDGRGDTRQRGSGDGDEEGNEEKGEGRDKGDLPGDSEEDKLLKLLQAQAISDWSNQIVLQGFNWESHGQPQGWWRHLASLAPAIAAAGFTAVWLPPASSSLAPQGNPPAASSLAPQGKPLNSRLPTQGPLPPLISIQLKVILHCPSPLPSLALSISRLPLSLPHLPGYLPKDLYHLSSAYCAESFRIISHPLPFLSLIPSLSYLSFTSLPHAQATCPRTSTTSHQHTVRRQTCALSLLSSPCLSSPLSLLPGYLPKDLYHLASAYGSEADLRALPSLLSLPLFPPFSSSRLSTQGPLPPRISIRLRGRPALSLLSSPCLSFPLSLLPGYLPKDLYHLASAYGSEADLRALIAAFRAAQPHTAVPSTSAANGATVAAASSPSAPAAGGAAVTDMNPGIGSNQAAECAPVVTNATGCSGTGSAATGDAGNAGGVRVIADVVVNHRVGLQQGEGGQWTRFDGTSMPWDESAVTCDTGGKIRCMQLIMGGRAGSGRAVTCDTGGKGNPSSGNVFEGVSNIDHSQPFVRRDLTAWLTWLQADVGFSGFRFDYAKGYSAAYVRGYVQGAQLRLCVGEYWDTCNYVGAQYDLDYDQDSHRGRIVEWVEGADRLATAFDFTTKAILQEAVKRKEWWRLKDKEGRPPGVMGLVPSHAVTFVDNHDTGSTQAHWPFPSHAIIQGYAYILTHPGIPSVFYDHFFDWGPDLKNQIQQLIDARRRAGIYCSSSIQILAADDSRYAAIVGRNLCVKIGDGEWSPDSKEIEGVLKSGDCCDVSEDGGIGSDRTSDRTRDSRKWNLITCHYRDSTLVEGSRWAIRLVIVATLTSVAARVRIDWMGNRFLDFAHALRWSSNTKYAEHSRLQCRGKCVIEPSCRVRRLSQLTSKLRTKGGRNLPDQPHLEGSRLESLSAPPSRMALEIRNIRVSIRCTSVRRRYIGMACSVFLLALLTSGTPPVSAFEHPTGDSYTFSDFHTEQGASNGYTPRELHLGVNSVDVSHPVAAGVDGGTIPVCIARTRLPARPRLRGVSRGFHVLRVTATIPAVGMPRGAFASGPKFEFCVHWNASQPLGDCPRGAWRTADRKGRWVVLRSPFEGAFIDVKQEGGVVGDHDVSIKIDEDLEPHRAVFFVLGFLLMLLAGHLSSMVAFYYGGGMTLGVLLVVIVILYQRYGGILLWREHDAGSAASGDRHSLPGVWLAAYVVCCVACMLMHGVWDVWWWSPVAFYHEGARHWEGHDLGRAACGHCDSLPAQHENPSAPSSLPPPVPLPIPSGHAVAAPGSQEQPSDPPLWLAGTCYGSLVRAMARWYVLWLAGTCYGSLVRAMARWYVLWLAGTCYGSLVRAMARCAEVSVKGIRDRGIAAKASELLYVLQRQRFPLAHVFTTHEDMKRALSVSLHLQQGPSSSLYCFTSLPTQSEHVGREEIVDVAEGTVTRRPSQQSLDHESLLLLHLHLLFCTCKPHTPVTFSAMVCEVELSHCEKVGDHNIRHGSSQNCHGASIDARPHTSPPHTFPPDGVHRGDHNMGFIGVIITYVTGAVKTVMEPLGLGDDVISPVVVFVLVLVVLIGAALGFWVVRKFILSPTGELDPPTVSFVKWGLRIIAATLLIMSSADAIIASSLLLLSLSTTLLLHLLSPRALALLSPTSTPSATPATSFLARACAHKSEQASEQEGEVGRMGGAFSPPQQYGTPPQGPMGGVGGGQGYVTPSRGVDGSPYTRMGTPFQGPPGTPRTPHPSSPLARAVCPSSFHRTPHRRHLTPAQAAAISHECTQAALQELAYSPGFGQWVLHNFDRIAITPRILREERDEAEIAATAEMEEGFEEEEG
ncbi:unnamed protein product [Closterium sp. NIES-53]